jgi:hypothetical protein
MPSSIVSALVVEVYVGTTVAVRGHAGWFSLRLVEKMTDALRTGDGSGFVSPYIRPADASSTPPSLRNRG